MKLAALRVLAFFLRLPFVRGRVTIFEFAFRLLNPSRKIVERTVNGLPVVIDLGQGEARAMYYNAYERAELSFIRRSVKPASVVIDVGANVGYLAAIFAGAVGPRGKVYAFEPHPRVFPYLKNLAEKSNGIIEAFQLAVADKTGDETIRFYASLDHPMWSSTQYGYSVSEVIDVGTVSLSEFIKRQNRQVDFIKIDVEGGEAPVLRGLTDHLASGGSPLILCEISAGESGANIAALDELAKLASQFAYRICAFEKNGNVRSISLAEVRNMQRTFNLVLLPSSAKLDRQEA